MGVEIPLRSQANKKTMERNPVRFIDHRETVFESFFSMSAPTQDTSEATLKARGRPFLAEIADDDLLLALWH